MAMPPRPRATIGAEVVAQDHRRGAVDRDAQQVDVEVDVDEAAGGRDRRVVDEQADVDVVGGTGDGLDHGEVGQVGGEGADLDAVALRGPRRPWPRAARAPRATITTFRPRAAASWDRAAPIPIEAPATNAHGPYRSAKSSVTAPPLMPGGPKTST